MPKFFSQSQQLSIFERNVSKSLSLEKFLGLNIFSTLNCLRWKFKVEIYTLCLVTQLFRVSKRSKKVECCVARYNTKCKKRRIVKRDVYCSQWIFCTLSAMILKRKYSIFPSAPKFITTFLFTSTSVTSVFWTQNEFNNNSQLFSSLTLNFLAFQPAAMPISNKLFLSTEDWLHVKRSSRSAGRSSETKDSCFLKKSDKWTSHGPVCKTTDQISVKLL